MNFSIQETPVRTSPRIVGGASAKPFQEGILLTPSSWRRWEHGLKILRES